MPDTLLQFLPITSQSADDVRARFDADANAGLDPFDPAFIDTTPGGFYWDLTQGCVLECARLWGFLAMEMVAQMFPGTASGDWLDLHGETIRLPRNDEIAATGSVLFVGDRTTLIPAGTQVATLQADPSADADPIVFATTRSITLMDPVGPTNLTATPSSTGGTLPAGTYYYVVTAIGANGETIASNEAVVTVTGATSSVVLGWTAVAGATDYNIYRDGGPDSETYLDHVGGTGHAYTDTGSHTPTAALAPTNRAPVTAAEPGSAGNVGAGAITVVLSPQAGVASISNPDPTSGGADVETDDRYRKRIIAAYGQSAGGGTVSDYIRWALSFAAVGFVAVQPLWAGAGTVRVIITDPDNHPNSASVIQQIQEFLDPVPQQGEGEASIGQLVTVTTPTLLAVTLAAHLVFDSGYSLDGAGGTIATRDALTTAVTAYLNRLAPGEHVILNKVIGQIVSVPGVSDVDTVLLNGSATNVVVGGLQVAEATLPFTFTA